MSDLKPGTRVTVLRGAPTGLVGQCGEVVVPPKPPKHADESGMIVVMLDACIEEARQAHAVAVAAWHKLSEQMREDTPRPEPQEPMLCFLRPEHLGVIR